MQNSCTNCGQGFAITQDDLKFYDEVSPEFGEKKYAIPPPTLCPDCRVSQNAVSPLPVDALKVLRFLQDNDFDTASRLKLEPALSQELERTIRNYIKYLLEREVKSVAWLDSLRAEAEVA